jgi:hypothetical protein
MHVEQVLGNVPPAQRCHCNEEQPKESGSTSGGEPGGGLSSRIRSLFGR